MARAITKSVEMYGGLVILHQTKRRDKGAQILYEFRIRPNSKNPSYQNAFWSPEEMCDTDVPDVIPLPLYDLDKFTLEEFGKMKLMDDGKIMLGNVEITAVDYQANDFFLCCDIPQQVIRPPYPVTKNNRGVFSHPLMTFEQAFDLLKTSLNKEDNYVVLSNTVIALVTPVVRYGKYQFSRMIKPKPLSESLTIDNLSEIMENVEKMNRMMINYNHTTASLAEFYRCAWILYNIKERYIEKSVEGWFIKNCVDFLDLYIFISNYSSDGDIIMSEMKYRYSFHGSYKSFVTNYMGHMAVLYNVDRIFNYNLHATWRPRQEVRSDHIKYFRILLYRLRKYSKVIIHKIDDIKLKKKIEANSRNLRKLIEIRETAPLNKAGEKLVDGYIKKETKRMNRIQMTDFIGSPRVCKEARKYRMALAFKELVPGIVTAFVSAIGAAIGMLFKNKINTVAIA